MWKSLKKKTGKMKDTYKKDNYKKLMLVKSQKKI